MVQRHLRSTLHGDLHGWKQAWFVEPLRFRQGFGVGYMFHEAYTVCHAGHSMASYFHMRMVFMEVRENTRVLGLKLNLLLSDTWC